MNDIPHLQVEMNFIVAKIVARPWSKVVLTACVYNGHFPFGEARLKIDRGSRIGQVFNSKGACLDFSDYSLVEVIVVLQTPHEYWTDAEFLEHRFNLSVVQ